jgi:hypothetical protein
MPSRLLSICILALALTSLATAQPATTTAPATTQASVKADQSTPRGALKSLTVAMNKGDAAGIKSVFAPNGDVENKMVDAVVNQQQALMKFRDAAVTAFGADEARKLTGDLDAAQAESLGALDQVPENITGDEATVGEGDQLVHLKKQGEKWTLPVNTLAPQINAQTVDKELSQVIERAKFFTDMADEMARGKYKTADEAGKALQLRVLQQVMSQQGPASQPSTAPASPQAPSNPSPGGL